MYTSPMDEIFSLQNPRIKFVVKLREDKRQRSKNKLTLVEGEYELEIALSSGVIPKEVYFCNELIKGFPRFLHKYDLIPVTRNVYEKMSQRENPDGLLAVIPITQNSIGSINISNSPLIILTESIEKPGNLGAILRTADAAGVNGILVSDPRVELYSPNVVRASRGTLFTVPAIETDNLTALKWLQKNQIRIIASSPDGKTPYTNASYKESVCILVGTEDAGLSDFWKDNADMIVTIPMSGKVNSLNVSTSTAILLYEAVRQRKLI